MLGLVSAVHLVFLPSFPYSIVFFYFLYQCATAGDVSLIVDAINPYLYPFNNNSETLTFKKITLKTLLKH
jgi:hypothetical protein